MKLNWWEGWTAHLFGVEAQLDGAFMVKTTDLEPVHGGGYHPCKLSKPYERGDIPVKWSFTGCLDNLKGTSITAAVGGLVLLDNHSVLRFIYVFPQAFMPADGKELTIWLLAPDLAAARCAKSSPVVQFGRHATTAAESLARLWPS